MFPECRSGLAGNELYHRDNAFVQREPLLSAKCAYIEGCSRDLSDGAFQPQQKTDARPLRVQAGIC
jgi:hypothetical protein